MRDEHLLPAIVRPARLSRGQPLPPLKGPGRGAGPAVAAQLGVVQEVPHEPDLRSAEAVDDHEFPVETRVERLEVGRGRRSRDSESSKALMARWFDAYQLKAHSQEDVVNGEQLHLEVRRCGSAHFKPRNRWTVQPSGTCWQAELSLRAVCPDMTNPPPPA